MKQITKKLTHFIKNNNAPTIGVYCISNDYYFSAVLLQTIEIDTPHYKKNYKGFDDCLFELSSLSECAELLYFVIIDTDIITNQQELEYKEKLVQRLFAQNSNIVIIELESGDKNTQDITNQYFTIPKNSHSYKRIEQIIYTVYSDCYIEIQKNTNKIVFSILTVLLIISTAIILYFKS